MRFRSAGRLSERDVGRRVTVRRRNPDGTASDVLGTLRALGPDAVTVERADGTAVTIPVAEVVAARAITPPRKPSNLPPPEA